MTMMMAVVGYCYKSLGKVSFFVFIQISITLESYIFIDCQIASSEPTPRRSGFREEAVDRFASEEKCLNSFAMQYAFVPAENVTR